MKYTEKEINNEIRNPNKKTRNNKKIIYDNKKVILMIAN